MAGGSQTRVRAPSLGASLHRMRAALIPATPTRAVPTRALVLSAASLAVPVLGVVAFPSWVQEDQGMLIWMMALVPAFLLAYYRGSRGVALALAFAMAVLSLTQVGLLLLGIKAPDWKLLLTVVTVLVAVCIALAVASLIVMPLLARAKRRVARALNTGTMQADSRQTDICAYLSAILLGGLLLNALLGWRWADPVAALVMAPLIAWEGVEALRGKTTCGCHDESA